MDGRCVFEHASMPVEERSECMYVRAPVYKSLDLNLLLTMDLCQRERLPMTMYLP